MKLPIQLALPQSARQRLTDALKHFDLAKVSDNLILSSVIQSGVLSFWAIFAAMGMDGLFVGLGWYLAAPVAIGLLTYGCLRAYLAQGEPLARWQEQVLLDCGVYLEVFDQQVEPPRRGMWARLARGDRDSQLNSDSLTRRISALIEYFPYVCAQLGIRRQPAATTRLRVWLVWLGSAALLALPLLTYWGVLRNDVEIRNVGEHVSNVLFYGVFGERYQDTERVRYDSSVDLVQLLNVLMFNVMIKGAAIGAAAWLTLLLPFLRLFGVIERAVLRRVMHDIVEGGEPAEAATASVYTQLPSAEHAAALSKLRGQVEESQQRLQRRSLRVR